MTVTSTGPLDGDGIRSPNCVPWDCVAAFFSKPTNQGKPDALFLGFTTETDLLDELMARPEM